MKIEVLPYLKKKTNEDSRGAVYQLDTARAYMLQDHAAFI